MVMSPGQTRPGGRGTVDVIADPNYARNQFAITPDFKTDVRNGQIVDASGTCRGKLEVPIGFEQGLGFADAYDILIPQIVSQVP